MRILIAAAAKPDPPLTDGYVLHLYHLVDGFADHEVRLVVPDGRSRTDDGDRRRAMLQRFHAVRRLGLGAVYWRHAGGLAAALAREIDVFEPDVVHVVGNRLAPLQRVIPADLPSVLGALDAPHLNLEAIETEPRSLQRLRLEIMVRMALLSVRRFHTGFDRVALVSREDADELQRVAEGLRTVVIPNGVDAGRYAASPDAVRMPHQIIFTGALGYPPNVSAARYLAREIFPSVRRTYPDAELRLVGRAPAPAVQRLGEIDGVVVVGPVPEMAPELSRASVYVCPMTSGTGIKNKLLEAMANGLPCVATTLATRGIDVEPGRHLVVADGVEEIAAAVVALLGDAERRRTIGDAAQRFVEERHTWRAMANAYLDVYRELVNESGRRRSA